MKDVRLAAEDRKHGSDPGSHYSRDTALDAIPMVPTFTCKACGQAYWNEREPVRCRKCGGWVFIGSPKVQEADILPTMVMRLRRDAQAVAAAVAPAGNGKLSRRAREMEQLADEMMNLAGGGK